GDSELPVDVRVLSATHKNLTALVANHEFREDLYYRLNVISLGMPPLRKRSGDVGVLADFILKKLATAHGVKKYHLTDAALDKLNGYEFPGNVRELENILERGVTFCEANTIEADDIQFASRLIDDDLNPDDLSIDLSDDEVLTTLSDNAAEAHSVAAAVVGDGESNLDDYLAEIEKKAIVNALAANDNNKADAAEQLGLSMRSLRYKLKKYDL
ncbi:MAG: sigma-54-dependent Fis family transcriptional regulator, partial [Gammaproteobacteria bacterium]